MNTPKEPFRESLPRHSYVQEGNCNIVRDIPQNENFEVVTAPSRFHGAPRTHQQERLYHADVKRSPHDRDLELSAVASSPRSTAVSSRSSSADRLLPHDGVTLLRAAICLSIVALHLQFEVAFRQADNLTFMPQLTWLVQHARLGFESFFVLAGYFLAHSFRPGPWKTFSVVSFYRRRLVRLLLPYWIIVFVSWLGLAGGSFRRHQPFDYPVTDLWKQMLCLHDLGSDRLVSGQLWFMAPLIQFHVIWGTIFWILRRAYLRSNQANYHSASIRWMSRLTVIVFLASIFFADFAGAGYTLSVNAHYLVLGCLIYWYSHSQIKLWLIIVALSLEVALGCAGGASRPIAAAVGGLLLMYGAGRTFSAGSKLKWLMSIGRCSYSIYLTHMFVGPRLMVLLGGWASFQGGDAFLWLAGIFGSVLGGHAYYHLVELPSATWSREFDYRRPFPVVGNVLIGNAYR